MRIRKVKAQLFGWRASARLALMGLTLAVCKPALAQAGPSSGLDPYSLLIFGIVAGLIAFAVGTAVICLRATQQARAAKQEADEEAARLHASESALKALLTAEPQTLLCWSPPEPPCILGAGLPLSLGVPRSVERLLDFPRWLAAESASALERASNELAEHGKAFTISLRTQTGSRLNVDGRASGNTITLRFRATGGPGSSQAKHAEPRSQELSALHRLLDATPFLAWMRGEDGRLLWVNRRYAEAVGALVPAQAVAAQMEILDVKARTPINASLAKGEPYRGTLESTLRGESRLYEVVAVPLAGASAGLAIEAGSARLTKGEVQRQLETRFRSLDRLSTAVAIFDSEQRLAHFNQAFVELWQLDPDWLSTCPRDGEILDRLRQSRKLPEEADYQAWKRHRLSIYEGSEASEAWWHLPDQRTIHVIADPATDGSVTYLYENVTEKLALESRYNALIRVQRETLDNLREGVAVFGPDGCLRLHNRAFATMWKLGTPQLESSPHINEVIGWCRVLFDDEAKWERTKMAITAIGAERRPYASQFERPDGSVIACATLPLPDGGTLLTHVDVTDTKRVERALVERNEALEAADRLKTQFISHISYELRTPLTSIIGFAELLANPLFGPLTQKQRDYVGDIHASGKTLLSIIDAILDLATIDAGAFVLTPAPVVPREVIDAAVLGVRERARKEGISIKVEVHEDAGEFPADRRRVTQVLYNLLSNAIGFSPPGGQIVLSCSRDRDMIAFTVKDEGYGIPEDFQRTVFDRFASRPHGSRHRGAGLGLSIVKSIVELHGGDVSLASAPGQGTSVCVRFPLRSAAVAEEADAEPLRPTGTSRAG